MTTFFGRSRSSINSLCYPISTQCRLFSQSILTSRRHYDILEVSPEADRQLIKAQFYKLSKQYHPDLNLGDETAHSKFVRINEAYSVLSNEQSRREYDRSIHRQLNNSNSRSRMKRSNVYSGYNNAPRHGRSGFNFHNRQKVNFNFQEHFQRHYGEELRRRARSEAHQEKEKHVRELSHKQSHRTIRISLLISMVIILGTGGQIFV
ncbi:14779_t:CDS:1 [Funneliformis caledonium]|uniref:14779_t:CDS:1 n=1 Tax=Funneliformis caledonium TaxID=1117310 RepID=A0A9N9D9Y3_9GLOM|nr:14779_t:CDS:1 [Funneliformis caledonium]